MPEVKQIITIHQYNSRPVSQDDMSKLMEIAKDYRTVKQYVYRRYGGIKSLGKLYPGYTVQNEMTESGFRACLGMPSVYFYLAMYDALADIKAGWTYVHGKILDRIREHENFTEQEKHYLRFCLKAPGWYASILNSGPRMEESHNQTSSEMPEEFMGLDKRRLDNYLCRQTRRYLKAPETDKADGFRIGVKAYRYGDCGIYISTKEQRKRIFIPLTDRSRFSRQLYIRLVPEENRIIIEAPVELKKKKHPDFQAEVGVAYGYHIMFTSSGGCQYGTKLGEYERKEAERVRAAMSLRSVLVNRQKQEGITEEKARNIRDNNLGRYKYMEKRRRYLERIKSYINGELNRFIEEEKPKTVYVSKLPPGIKATRKKQLNHSMTMWRRGYIRKRLLAKCETHSILVEEVMGKGISCYCSSCQKAGVKKEHQFLCPECGLVLDEKVNTARNVLLRGRGDSYNRFNTQNSG